MQTSATPHLERFASSITAWAERWFPDSYIFAILTVVAVAVAALAAGAPASSVASAFGDGFWSLIPFTMQMAMVVISGYVVASSPPAAWAIARLASLPRTERGAIAWIAFLTILASLFNWAFSLVFGGLYAQALARREDLRVDYRSAGAAAYLGLGATWALGLSSSAAQLQANIESIPKSLLPITGVIPFRETIFLPQSLVMLATLTIVSVAISYYSAPDRERALTARDLNIDLHEPRVTNFKKVKPSDRIENSPWLTLIVVALGSAWLAQEFWSKDPILAISNLNTYNLLFILLGMLLHFRPRRFLTAVEKAVPSVAGILIQFPLYGSIAFILTKASSPDGGTLSHHLSSFFLSISNAHTFSAVMGAYSAILGFFIPSGGGKWIIEAPYLMQAANDLKVHLGWTVMVYNAAEALPNLINPFFMMPLLGVLGLKARDIVGYTATQLVFHAPLVLFLLWALGETLTYVPPH